MLFEKVLSKLSPKTEIQSENKDKDWQKQKTNKDRQRSSPQKG